MNENRTSSINLGREITKCESKVRIRASSLYILVEVGCYNIAAGLGKQSQPMAAIPAVSTADGIIIRGSTGGKIKRGRTIGVA
jgi:hypothetical protein